MYVTVHCVLPFWIFFSYPGHNLHIKYAQYTLKNNQWMIQFIIKYIINFKTMQLYCFNFVSLG